MVAFDYTPLNGKGRSAKQSAARIRKWAEKCEKAARVTAQMAIKIGAELARVNEHMPHGMWMQWLESEFGWSYRKARYYIAISDKFKSAETANLSVWVLAVLSGENVPQEARDEAVKRAEEGERVTVADAKQIIAECVQIKPAINRITAAHAAGVGSIEPAAAPLRPAPLVAPSIPMTQPAAGPKSEPSLATTGTTGTVAQAESLSVRDIVGEIARLSRLLPDENLIKVHQMLGRFIEERMPKVEVETKAVPTADEISTRVATMGEVETEVPKEDSLIGFDPVDMKLPEKLDVPRFRVAWSRWAKYCVTQGQPMNEFIATAQLKQLNQRSVEAAINAIDTAIAGRTTILPKSKDSRPKTEPPTVQQVQDYAKAMNYSGFEADRFVDYYESQGWKKANGQPLVDWKGGVRNWAAKRKEEAQKKPGGSAASNGAYEKFVPDRMIPNASGQRTRGATVAAVASASVRSS